MASYSPKLLEKKYNNWVKAQLAVSFTKEAVEPFVCHEIQQFQLKCLHDIWYSNGVFSGTCCSSCCTENVVHCPTDKICKVRCGKCKYHRNNETMYKYSGCPNKICHNFKTEIQNAHRYNGPSYKNSDATQWCSNFWEVAKCFMPPDGYKEKASAAETDFNGIISVILNYKDFQGKIRENLNSKRNMFEEAREIGRNVRHSPRLEVEDSDLNNYFQLLHKLLSELLHLTTDTQAYNAKLKLLLLQSDNLVIGKDDIRKVLDDVATVIQDKMKAGLDDQYDRIKLDMIRKKQEDLLTLESKTAKGMTQVQDKTDASVKRFNNERDKEIDTIHKKGVKEKINLAELGETFQKELKTASKAEKEEQFIDSKQNLDIVQTYPRGKPYKVNKGRQSKFTESTSIPIDRWSKERNVFKTSSDKMEQNVPKAEQARLFESFLESSAQEEKCYKFASTLGQHTVSPRGNFIDTRDVPYITESVYESTVRVEASRCVCMICFPGGTATGFRVGARYIMTADHVVNHILKSKGYGQTGNKALQSEDVFALFDYKKNEPILEHQKFSFTAAVPFRDKETDCAILELEEKCNGPEMPGSFKSFGLPRLNQRFTFIGHSLGKHMEFNHVDRIIDIESAQTKRDIIQVNQKSLEHSGIHYDMPPHNTLTNPNRFLFHCKFTKGASGSPGVVVFSDGRFEVVTMLLCGLPDWYYGSNVHPRVKGSWPKDHCVEQGANLQSVIQKMYQENKSLCYQIFNVHKGYSPNQ